MQQTLAEAKAGGDELFGLGDGFVEIENIKQLGGVAVGVPVDSGGLGASLAGAAAAAGGAANAATAAVEAGSGKNDEQATPLADAAMSWLEVFVVGLGEEQCDQRDLECLKRQRQTP
jgi:hypothetical protein